MDMETQHIYICIGILSQRNDQAQPTSPNLILFPLGGEGLPPRLCRACSVLGYEEPEDGFIKAETW
jgi:hypothetical protein